MQLVNLQQLREKLKQGFYLDNLHEVARLCESLALGVNSPAPFFFMEHVFLAVAKHWEDRPLREEEAEVVNSLLLQPLEDLVEGIEANTSSDEILNLLNKVVSAYLISFG